MTRQYRVLFLDRSQSVMREMRIMARDDDAAIDLADDLAGLHAAEVWDGLRQVARLARGRSPDPKEKSPKGKPSHQPVTARPSPF